MPADGLTTWGATLRLADLSPARDHSFSIAPDADVTAALADELGFSALRKLRFEGKLTATGKRDWHLSGTLGATVIQPCVVTLEPVTTRIDAPVTRTYMADFAEPEIEDAEADAEIEMTADDSVEPLPATLDLSTVAIEALALAAPDYPRADGAELGELRVTEPGKDAMSDEDAKPFAGLKALRDKLGGTD